MLSLYRFSLNFLSWLSLLLAVTGVILPGLPTTPFLLLAVWSGRKSNNRLYRFLLVHPWSAASISLWQQQKAISRFNKICALLVLIISLSLLIVYQMHFWLIIAVAVVFTAVAAFLLTRPEPKATLKIQQNSMQRKNT